MNFLARHPEAASRLRAACDGLWSDVLPCLENEDAVGPRANPFKARYGPQFGGGPDAELRRFLDPETTTFSR